MNKLRIFFWLTDIGFVVYWLVTLTHIIPEEFLFKDYRNPILMNWNWSFLPLDLVVSLTGFLSLYYWKTIRPWKGIALVSLALTFASGLQAISYWVLAHDFDLLWWLPNLYLLIYPLFFIWKLIIEK